MGQLALDCDYNHAFELNRNMYENTLKCGKGKGAFRYF